MTYSKKTILTGIFSVIIFFIFLSPKVSAREWTYVGVDTERIPEFLVYPSEWYIYSNTYYGTMFNHSIYEVVKANISNLFMWMPNLPPFYGNFTNGTCIFVNNYLWNTTADEELWCYEKEIQIVYWNGTAYLGNGAFLPIDEDSGVISGDILNNFSYFMESMFSRVNVTFENKATYPNSFSIHLWNTTDNNAYLLANFTENGILTKMEGYLVSNMFNMTLYSKPAQLPPDFSFTTETGILTVDTTEFKLNLTINDADNNNDGIIDTEYLYRIFTGTGWTGWASIPNQIAFDLGPDAVEADYGITIEVKNMYGVTQEQILVNYNLPGETSETISGYSIILVSIFAMLGISVIIYKYPNKLKYLIHQ